MASKYAVDVALDQRKRCPNLHSHMTSLCLSDFQRHQMEYPQDFRSGTVTLPNFGRYVTEKIPSAYERICQRCLKNFRVNSNGENLDGTCYYHDGLRTETWSCCGRRRNERGCIPLPHHVHKGNLQTDISGFVQFASLSFGAQPRVLGLDTESVYTCHGLEVARISLIDVRGATIYERYVLPENRIIDYNTKYSGISSYSFPKERAIPLKQVHDDLQDIVFADSVFVGHSLKHDFRGLKIFHRNVVDTCFHYKDPTGKFRGLKYIARDYLQRSIQSGYGHDSKEDAVAAMDAALMLIRNCDGKGEV